MEQWIIDKLKEREAQGTLRSLANAKLPIDFWSNDYLGFASDPVKADIAGSTGSRLVSGNNSDVDRLEQFLCKHYHAPSALVFNSGYDANIGLMSSLGQRGTTILYDELVHASIRDGIRLGLGKSYSFRHNDLEDLKQRIERSEGQCMVVVESVYSMDGDRALLDDIAALCATMDAHLIVDEAHAVGVFGELGAGLCSSHIHTMARVVTFSKAWGRMGAAVLGSENLRSYLINFARSFIYTTGLPGGICNAIETVHTRHDEIREAQARLADIGAYFQAEAEKRRLDFIDHRSPIRSYLIEGNIFARKLADACNARGIAVKAMLSPTVPAGTERLRVCLHIYNTKEEVNLLLETIKEHAR